MLFKVISFGGARGGTISDGGGERRRMVVAEGDAFGLDTKTGNGKDWIKCSAAHRRRYDGVTVTARVFCLGAVVFEGVAMETVGGGPPVVERRRRFAGGVPLAATVECDGDSAW